MRAAPQAARRPHLRRRAGRLDAGDPRPARGARCPGHLLRAGLVDRRSGGRTTARRLLRPRARQSHLEPPASRRARRRRAARGAPARRPPDRKGRRRARATRATSLRRGRRAGTHRSGSRPRPDRVLWSVDPLDWQEPPAETIVERTLAVSFPAPSSICTTASAPARAAGSAAHGRGAARAAAVAREAQAPLRDGLGATLPPLHAVRPSRNDAETDNRGGLSWRTNTLIAGSDSLP